MATGKARGAKTYLNSKGPKKPKAHLKDRRRAQVPGRAAQGLGSAGRSGGTKSSGGRAGRQGRVQGGIGGGRRTRSR